jgi:hypothetical protein
VKELAATPLKVLSAVALNVIVAVYVAAGANLTGLVDHETVPVYWLSAVTEVTGVAPVTGAVTPEIAR